jgi:hypothetical protein
LRPWNPAPNPIQNKMKIPTHHVPALRTEPEDRRHNPQQRDPAILFWVAAALAALFIDFGSFHRLHNSDSLVPVLESLWRWTPFYWEQDRFGMLVPLLAIPFRNPLTNLLAQSAVNAFCGLATFFLCARYVVREAWLFAGAFSASLFLLFMGVDARFLYLGLSQPYGVGMFVGLAGLLLLENTRRSRALWITLSFICLLAASWVDAAVIFALLPLIVFRRFFVGTPPETRGSGERRRFFHEMVLKAKHSLDLDTGIAVALVIFSFVASYIYSGIVSHSAAYGDWPYAPVRPWKWPVVWLGFGETLWQDYLSQPWGISVALLLVLGILVRLAARGRVRRTNSPAAILIASSVASFLLMGSLAHIEDTGFDSRFGLQSMVLLQIGAVVWALLPVYSLLNRSGRRVATAAGMGVFLVAPLYLYGRPSLTRVRADLNDTLGEYTPEILQSGATHIIGDYWNVWPATFDVNLALYEAGGDRTVWGVTTRSTPTQIYWSKIPQDKMRFAAVTGDAAVAYVVNLYSLPALTQVQTFKDIVILAPAPNPQ